MDRNKSSPTRACLAIACAIGVCAAALPAGMQASAQEAFSRWSLSKAVGMLNASPWARQETFTTVVGGVGSGRSGEKEIYSTFYVRFLSAGPVREAYARIQQIRHGYDALEEAERLHLDELINPILQMDVQDWIVVTVGFRSNDPNQESLVRRFFQSQTVETLMDRAFLSTPRFSQVKLSAYFQPREESVGAKFVFPRRIDGVAVASDQGGTIAFELLEVPAARPRLRAVFTLENMVVEGELVI